MPLVEIGLSPSTVGLKFASLLSAYAAFARSRMNVLLVEDHDDARETLHALLALKGYDVKCARNGREALQSLLDSGRPDVVIMDLMMPEMNGWQLRTEMLQRESLAAIPVIIVTAALTWRNHLPPAMAYLKKPIDIDELFALLERQGRARDLQ